LPRYYIQIYLCSFILIDCWINISKLGKRYPLYGANLRGIYAIYPPIFIYFLFNKIIEELSADSTIEGKGKLNTK
jgi:hypothetical protein